MTENDNLEIKIMTSEDEKNELIKNLEIKPADELTEIHSDDIELVEKKEIFKRPETKKLKKKTSERQKAHLKKMREIRKRNAEERKKLRLENKRIMKQPVVLKKKVHFEEQTIKRPPTPKQPLLEKQDGGLDKFFNNFEKFMSVMDKYNKSKQPPQIKAEPKVVPKSEPLKRRGPTRLNFMGGHSINSARNPFNY